MNQYLQYLVIIGAIVNLSGSISYVKDTLQGRTKPNRVTWLLWAVAPLIASAAANSAKVGWAILPVFMSGFGPLLVFIASFINKSAYWKLERLDYLCGLCSALALILWIITKDPIIAIVFSLISDAFAAVPTVVKAWRYPETETSYTYFAGSFNALTSFAAVRAWDFASVAFPIYLVAVNVLLVLCIHRRKLFKREIVEQEV